VPDDFSEIRQNGCRDSRMMTIGAGTIFRLGEQKFGEKQLRQSNSKYNFMQYAFFEKGILSVQWGLGQSPRSWGSFENFCVMSNLTVCKVTMMMAMARSVFGW